MGGGALESRGLPHRTQCRRSLSSPRVPKSGKKRKRTGAKLGPKLCAGRSGSSAPTPPAFTLTFSPQGGRGGDKQTKPGARRAGTPVKTSSNNTQFDNNIYRRKRDYRLQKKTNKKKTSQTGLPLGERTATDLHTRCRRDPHPRASVWYIPTHHFYRSLHKPTETLSERNLIEFCRSNNQLCQSCAVSGGRWTIICASGCSSSFFS